MMLASLVYRTSVSIQVVCGDSDSGGTTHSQHNLVIDAIRIGSRYHSPLVIVGLLGSISTIDSVFTRQKY